MLRSPSTEADDLMDVKLVTGKYWWGSLVIQGAQFCVICNKFKDETDCNCNPNWLCVNKLQYLPSWTCEYLLPTFTQEAEASFTH